MTIKEHIAFAKTVLARIRNEDPEAINPILEEMSQWKRVDALVEACRAKFPLSSAEWRGAQLPTHVIADADTEGMAILNALSALEAHGDIEPAQPIPAHKP